MLFTNLVNLFVMDLDTYYDNHPLNPANQPEPVSVVSYEVLVYCDEFGNTEAHLKFDTLYEAEVKFNQIAFGTEYDWVELTIEKTTDGFQECIKSALSSTLFLEMKRNLARIREIEVNAPMGLTSDEHQELLELKRKLYNN